MKFYLVQRQGEPPRRSSIGLLRERRELTKRRSVGEEANTYESMRNKKILK
jgi:hypothetical protein